MCDCPASVQQPAGDGLDTAADQLAALMPHAHESRLQIQPAWWRGRPGHMVLSQIADVIIEGHKEHGRGLFDMSDAQLAFELERELEDAIIYRAEQLRRAALK